jgi:hypothetical protein
MWLVLVLSMATDSYATVETIARLKNLTKIWLLTSWRMHYNHLCEHAGCMKGDVGQSVCPHILSSNINNGFRLNLVYGLYYGLILVRTGTVWEPGGSNPYSDGLRAGQPWNCGSITGKGKWFVPSSQRLGRLWGPPSLLSNGHLWLFPGGRGKRQWREAVCLHPTRLHGVVLN